MKHKNIYIQAAEQISIQSPLSDDWMTNPTVYDEPLVKACDPVFRDYISPRDARRMGKLMRRAIVTSQKVIRDTAIEHPDAIITGTSIGSLDYTERFLDDMTENGEETLSPTYFMQSTHNTVGSTIGIYTKSHGYNTTYSHGQCSFDLALQDAWMQLQLGMISNALVNGQEEMVDSYFELLKRRGYVGQPGMVPCSELSMSMILNTTPSEQDLCELVGVRITGNYAGLGEELDALLESSHLTREDISGIMTGVNGCKTVDDVYYRMASDLLPDASLMRYKHIFGENLTVSALGVYAAAKALKNGSTPEVLMDQHSRKRCDKLSNVLLLNHMNGQQYSLILLKKI